MASVRAMPLQVNQADQTADAATSLPPQRLNSSSRKPRVEHSSTFPGRRKRKYKPMKTAIGIVMRMVNVPQGLPLRAFTTTSPTTASRTIMIKSTVTSETNPPTLPISSRAIWPSVLPSRRMEQKRMIKSWTAPASTAPNKIQSVPGK